MNKYQTLQPRLSMKCPKNGISRQYLRQYFVQNFDLYDTLFECIKNESSFYSKPEPLRHPLIFYYGHTASFYINKLVDRGLIEDQVDDVLEATLAVGVDEMDWDDLDKTQYKWPTVQQVKDYRKQVRQIVIDQIQKCDLKISYDSEAWTILLGIEHEKIHFETSAAIIRRLPIDQIQPSNILIDFPQINSNGQPKIQNTMKIVPECKVKWERTKLKQADYYGWDNQFGDKMIQTPEFKASSMLVSNAEFLEFVKDNGYNEEEYWDQQGLAWVHSVKPTKPIFWKGELGSFKLRTMNKLIPLPLDWPVQVNNLEATAFCKWKSKKMNKNLRLPTEDQYHALRQLMPEDHFEWKHGTAGNLNLQGWFSPCPVNLFQTNGFYDIIGNVWQHTCTPFHPFKDFEIHQSYEDYSTPCFDARHYLIKGGSFATIGDLTTKHARDTFRRHFYQFAGFRYVQSSVPVQCPQSLLDECDKKVEIFLKMHYAQKDSYIQHAIRTIKQKCSDPHAKFLNVGCSVGRMVLQMSKHFQKSYGTDFSARFFQMATRMLEKDCLKYKDLEISAQEIIPKKQNIVLYQINPENPDPKKINGFKVIVIDGMVIKAKTIHKVVKKFLSLMVQNSFLMIINGECRNKISHEEIRQMNDSIELIDEKVVPFQEWGEQKVNINLYSVKSL